MLYFAYYPVLVATTVIFLAFDILIWPLVFIKMIFHKLTMVWVYSRSFRVSRADKFRNFIHYCMVGPAIIVGNTFVDLCYFWKHMLLYDLQKVKHKTGSTII